MLLKGWLRMRLNFLSHNGPTDRIVQYKSANVCCFWTRSGRRRVIHDSIDTPPPNTWPLSCLFECIPFSDLLFYYERLWDTTIRIQIFFIEKQWSFYFNTSIYQLIIPNHATRQMISSGDLRLLEIKLAKAIALLINFLVLFLFLCFCVLALLTSFWKLSEEGLLPRIS